MGQAATYRDLEQPGCGWLIEETISVDGCMTVCLTDGNARSANAGSGACGALPVAHLRSHGKRRWPAGVSESYPCASEPNLDGR
jgi:hypothetical protein